MENTRNFLELVQSRYSVRKFSDKEVEREKIDKILRAGQVAPTACNLQPQRILVINSKEAINKFRKCTECHFNAPLAILVCHDKDKAWKRSYDGKSSGDIDASIVTTHMMLEAFNLGIGSTWVMHFIPEAIREEFNLPENYEATSILVMGYPAEDAKPFPGHADKKNLEETVCFNEFTF
ncbi:MAG: nitroreductase [Clostridium sp.]|nr:nitroreductase [Clostridium sp.]